MGLRALIKPDIFQSTHPARGATTLRGADLCGADLYFNPRTPRGVRPQEAWGLVWRAVFQSTHPARGAT